MKDDDVSLWVRKAEGDFRIANREFKIGEDESYDAACFLAQQCVEKLMKALLIRNRVPPPKSHNLVLLQNLLIQVCPTWHATFDDLELLTRAAHAFRYPGEFATHAQAREALRICSNLRLQALTLLNLVLD